MVVGIQKALAEQCDELWDIELLGATDTDAQGNRFLMKRVVQNTSGDQAQAALNIHEISGTLSPNPSGKD